VFTVPHRLRYRLAFDHALCHAVLGVSVSAVLGAPAYPRVAQTRRSQPASQDFTPRPLIQAIVDGIAPQPGQVHRRSGLRHRRGSGGMTAVDEPPPVRNDARPDVASIQAGAVDCMRATRTSTKRRGRASLGDYYWSSTSETNRSTLGWALSFQDGSRTTAAKDATLNVRAVRGGP
jgi:hypothetical protein